MIEVLLFAHLREQFHADRLALESGPITVASLLRLLKEHYPHVRLDRVMVAVNEEIALCETLIRPGDAVALLPPVSGG